MVGDRLLPLALGLALLCPTSAADGQPLSFSDRSPAAGLVTTGFARGVAVADYDMDGWDDIYVSVLDGVSSLFRNDQDGTFTDVGVQAGVSVDGRSAVALWGDVNNDGRPDLFVAQRWGSVNRLFLQSGDGTFRDVAAGSGLDRRATVETAAFGDIDGDGRLDLFLATLGGSDLLYLGAMGEPESGVLFVDITEQAGVAGLPASVAMQATWVDHDRDGDLDLFAVHDGHTVESRLYRNDGRLPLVDIARAAGIASVGAGNSMGVAWGDIDGDGWEDAYVTRIGTGGLYRSNGDGTFTDVAIESGAARNGWAWGVVFADLDLDGDQDLFVASEYDLDGTPSLLYRNDGGSFTEVGASAGADLRVNAFGAAAGDFNNDGYVDLVVADAGGRSRLLVNTTRPAGNWLKVRLAGSTINRMAIGTRVEVTAGGETYARVVRSGDSYCSQSSPVLHFGVGGAATIDRLRIHWSPDSIEERRDLDVNRTYRFVEAESGLPAQSFLRGDCDGDGRAGDTSDAITLLAYSFSGGSVPPCLAACDVDRDARASIADAVYLLQFGFLGGPAPSAPFPDCGAGTRSDRELGCASGPTACR